MQPESRRTVRHYLDVVAAYNREDLPVEPCSGVCTDSIEEIMAHPFHWAHLSERETEEVLMEIYVARRRRMQ
jgi:hypothetical protein